VTNELQTVGRSLIAANDLFHENGFVGGRPGRIQKFRVKFLSRNTACFSLIAILCKLKIHVKSDLFRIIQFRVESQTRHVELEMCHNRHVPRCSKMPSALTLCITPVFYYKSMCRCQLLSIALFVFSLWALTICAVFCISQYHSIMLMLFLVPWMCFIAALVQFHLIPSICPSVLAL
jgi:hypothetical protein